MDIFLKYISLWGWGFTHVGRGQWMVMVNNSLILNFSLILLQLWSCSISLHLDLDLNSDLIFFFPSLSLFPFLFSTPLCYPNCFGKYLFHKPFPEQENRNTWKLTVCIFHIHISCYLKDHLTMPNRLNLYYLSCRVGWLISPSLFSLFWS